MYRNRKVDGSKSILKCQQSSSVNKSKENLVNVEESLKNTNESSIRSTAKILNLFQRQAKSHDEEIPKESSTLVERQDKEVNVTVESDNNGSNKIIFSVVIGKKSMRKHKKWDDDGILEVTGKNAILKDTDGNVIQRTTVNPETLIEGFRMYIDNKEIEIIEKTTSLCSAKSSTEKKILGPPTKKLKTSTSNSYLPLKSLYSGLKLKCDPLVMPALNDRTSWLEADEHKNEKEVSVDACLVNALRPHQRQGISFIYECIMGLKVPNYFGAILADEMGLGKTLQCITLIWTLLKKGPHGHPVLRNVLIVTPSSLCNNWNKEFKHWLGFHRISPYIVNAENRPKDYKKQARDSVMIISYNMLSRCLEEVAHISFDLIVCDEGHQLKNNNIKTAKVLQSLDCKRRILLTGTPIQNDLQEFYALVDFVNPGILGNSTEFKNYYENPIVASRCPNASHSVISLGQERAAELRDKTKAFILRRTQETINKYLPSKHELIVFCRLSDEQETLYTNVTDAWFSKNTVQSSAQHFTLITTLKKICNDPELFCNDQNEFQQRNFKGSSRRDTQKKAYRGKVSIVQAVMKNLKKTDEKLVLISYYTQTLDLLENLCNGEGLEFYRLDGSTSSSTRTKIIERFNSKTDNSKVFLLSAKAGGVGLNLPGASRLILFDSDWNPASDSQAMARIWRDGQKKDVYVLRLLTTGTIEEKIFQRQISKAGLSETVVDLNSFASMKLPMSVLKDLFTLSTSTSSTTHDLMRCDCNGYKNMGKASEVSSQEDDRECQLLIKDETEKTNLTINQLLNWEHYQQPVPDKILQEIMLSEASDNITFVLKNSILNKT